VNFCAPLPLHTALDTAHRIQHVLTSAIFSSFCPIYASVQCMHACMGACMRVDQQLSQIIGSCWANVILVPVLTHGNLFTPLVPPLVSPRHKLMLCGIEGNSLTMWTRFFIELVSH